MDKEKMTLVKISDARRRFLKSEFNGFSIGVNKCIDFLAENIVLHREAEARKISALKNAIHTPEDEYRCSCCDGMRSSRDCMFYKWDKAGKTAVGVCGTCRESINASSFSTVSEFLKHEDKKNGKR